MENYKKTNLMDFEAGKVKGFSGMNLINLENGGFKKVKVSPFSTYPSHLHPNKTEFIYVLTGKPKITIGQHNYEGEQDDFFVLPSSIKHSIDNPTDTECFILVGAINNL
ncbi:cupin domain-containing protein [Flavobacteriaceae bacterium LMO-SS05]